MMMYNLWYMFCRQRKQANSHCSCHRCIVSIWRHRLKCITNYVYNCFGTFPQYNIIFNGQLSTHISPFLTFYFSLCITVAICQRRLIIGTNSLVISATYSKNLQLYLRKTIIFSYKNNFQNKISICGPKMYLSFKTENRYSILNF